MKNRVYISLACLFFWASVLLYAFVFLTSNQLTDWQYFNAIGIDRLLFAWGFTYAIFAIEQYNKHSIRVWFLKWSSIYVTGFCGIRAFFNALVNEKVTNFELILLLLGFVITIFLAIKNWRSDDTR